MMRPAAKVEKVYLWPGSTGGKANFLGISKRSDKNLRLLLVQCARVYI